MPLAELVSPIESFEQPSGEPLPLDPRIAAIQSEIEPPQAKEQALESIVHEFGESLTGFAASITGSSHTAEEVVQEVFIRVFTKAGQFQGGSMKAWLYTITHNLALNTLRKERLGTRLLPRPDAGDTQSSPDEEVISNAPSRLGDPAEQAEFNDVLSVLTGLPLSRGTIILSSAFGYTAEETARYLDVSVTQVKHRLRAGRQAARSALREP